MSPSLTQSLKIKYFLVVSAALLALVGEHAISLSTIAQQQSSAAQRNLIDHIDLVVDRMFVLEDAFHQGTLDNDKHGVLKGKLSTKVRDMETTRSEFLKNLPSPGAMPPVSGSIHSLLDGPTARVNQWIDDLISHMQLHVVVGPGDLNNNATMVSMESHRPDQEELRDGIDQIRNFYVLKHQRMSNRLSYLLFARQGVLLIAFAFITFFVFRPAIRRISASNKLFRDNEALSQKIIETAAEGYALIDPEKKTYLEINNSLCEMLGYTRDEMIGKTPSDFCDAESLETFRSQVETATETDHRHYEITMRHKDGFPVYTRYNASTLRPSAEGTSITQYAFITDVSDTRKAIEALKKERDNAQQATDTKDKVVSLIAHDLKNPLGAIRGFSEFMLIDKRFPLSDHHRSAIKNIYDQSDDMLTLISDVMDISRLQTGNFVINHMFMDVHYLIDKILQRLEPMATAKQVTLVNKVPSGTRVYADSTLLGQVFQNLLTNAIKFSHAISEVHVVLTDGDDTHETLSIAVRDFGIGVSEKAIKNLFKLEEKTSTDGTSGEKGTGFGLPLTHQIMTAHKGDLIATSVEGEGSAFTIVLQDKVPEVLVVDDDPIFLKIIGQYLGPMNVKVTECENGEEAWGLLNNDFRPHLIISDIKMPVRNGIDLLVDIRMNLKMAHIPIIMVTGDGDESTRERILKLGAQDFVNKPIDPADFVPRVRQFIA